MSAWPAGSTSASNAVAGEAFNFVGHHLSEAVVLRRDMGEIDDGALAQEAAKRLAAVAWRLMATDLTFRLRSLRLERLNWLPALWPD